MFDNDTEKTLRLIAAGVYLKKMHGLSFACLVLIDAGLREGVVRAALQDEKVYLDAVLTKTDYQNYGLHIE